VNRIGYSIASTPVTRRKRRNEFKKQGTTRAHLLNASTGIFKTPVLLTFKPK
jgi:hypothetical protein